MPLNYKGLILIVLLSFVNVYSQQIKQLKTIHISHQNKKHNKHNTLDKNTLSKSSTKTLGDVLEKIAGSTAIKTGNNVVKPMIEGLHSNRVIISYNGVQLEEQQWGIDHAPNVDLNSVEKITVIKGAETLAYSTGAVGGVVIVKPARVFVMDTIYGATSTCFQNNGRLSSVNSRIDKSYQNGWFYKLQGFWKKSGDFQTPGYYLTNTGIDSKGGTVHFGLKKYHYGWDVFYSNLASEIGILRAAHIGNTSDLLRAIQSAKPNFIKDFSFEINNPKQKVHHQIIKIKGYLHINDTKITTQYDFQKNNRLEFDIRRGTYKDRPAMDLTLQTHNLSTTADIKKGHHHYKIGFSAKAQDNFVNPQTKVKRLIPDYKKYLAGIFAIADFHFEPLNIYTGIRYDYSYINAHKFYITSRWEQLGYEKDFRHLVIKRLKNQLLANPILQYHNIGAAVDITYSANPQNILSISARLANRPPNIAELFSEGLHHSVARIEIGDMRIRPETAYKINGRYQFNSTRLEVNLTAFYNRIQNFIYSIPTGIEHSLRGAFIVWGYRQTNARLFGSDLQIAVRPFKNFIVKNHTAFIKGIDLKSNEALIHLPPLKNITSIGFEKKQWLDFYATLKGEIYTMQNEFPNNNFEAFIPITGKKELVDVSTPPAKYELLHFYSGLILPLKKYKLRLNFSIENILNRSFRNYLNRMRYFSDELGRNFKVQLIFNY